MKEIPGDGESQQTGQIMVVITDDHDIVCDGLRTWLEGEPDITVIAQAKNGLDALDVVRTKKPAVLLIDIHMPKLSGLQVVSQLREEGNPVPIIVMTGYDKNRVRKALDAGANGYISKEEPREVLIEAIRWAARKEEGIWVSPVALHLMMQIEEQLRNSELTKMEMQLMTMLNLDNAEICKKLEITDSTLRNHLSSIYFKLRVEKRREAIARARDFGLIDS